MAGRKNGLVHLYYGDGQGKTCAAMGLAMRACGGGYRVLVAQFLKNGKSGELAALGYLSERVELLPCKPCRKFFYQMDEQEREETIREQRGMFDCVRQKVARGGYDLLILDEIVDAVQLGMIPLEELLGFLQSKPEKLEVALTGHQAYPELLEASDYVSEIKKIKHPYDAGIGARKGFDF